MQKFYKPERDKDFFDVCEAIRKETKDYQSVEDIAVKAILRPANSIFITQKHIACIIQEMRCGTHSFKGVTKLQNQELFNRYWELKKQNPTFSPNKIAKIIEEQKAPRFYISQKTAKSLYYKLLKCHTL